jgi:hypothetical protein
MILDLFSMATDSVSADTTDLKNFFDSFMTNKENSSTEQIETQTLQYYYSTPSCGDFNNIRWINDFVAICPYPDSTPFIEIAAQQARETVEKICPGCEFYPEKVHETVNEENYEDE